MENLFIENARIIFRNFGGREQQFNSAGDRNFCVVLEPKMAEELKKEGWNVKELRPREEGDEPEQYMQVTVNYSKGQPPRVIIINSRGDRLDLGADEVEILDTGLNVKNFDIMINPYAWEVSGNKGIKAYLKTAYITIIEDEIDMKYRDLQDQDANPTPSSSIVSEVA